MIKRIKVMLLPNEEQNSKLLQYVRASIFANDWAFDKQQGSGENNKILSYTKLTKEFNQLRKTEEFSWLKNIPNNVTKQAIRRVCNVYRMGFKRLARFPKFRRRKPSMQKFDCVKIKFTDTHVKLEGFTDWIQLAEHGCIPIENVEYKNSKIEYDGSNWWITVDVFF